MMGKAKLRQMARFDTGMVQTSEESKCAKKQMVRSETGMLQTCEDSECGDGRYSEKSDCEFGDWHVTDM
jgi:hypothetical protein